MVINDGFNRFLWEDHANIMGYNNGIFGETYLMGCIQANLQTCRTFGSMLDDIFCFFFFCGNLLVLGRETASMCPQQTH